MYLLSILNVNFKNIIFYGVPLLFLLLVSLNIRAEVTLTYPEDCSLIYFNCSDDIGLPGIPSLGKAEYIATIKQWAIENNLIITNSDIDKYLETNPYNKSNLDAISLEVIDEDGASEQVNFLASGTYSILGQMRDIIFLESMQKSIADFDNNYINEIGGEDKQFTDMFDRAKEIANEYKEYTGTASFFNHKSNPLLSTLFGAGSTSYGDLFNSDGMVESFAENQLIELSKSVFKEDSLVAGLKNTQITLKKPGTWMKFGTEFIQTISVDALEKNKVINPTAKSVINNMVSTGKAVTGGTLSMALAPAQLYYKTFSNIIDKYKEDVDGAYFTLYYYVSAKYPEKLGKFTGASGLIKNVGKIALNQNTVCSDVGTDFINNLKDIISPEYKKWIAISINNLKYTDNPDYDHVADSICDSTPYKTLGDNAAANATILQKQHTASIANLLVFIKNLDIKELKKKVVQQIAVESYREKNNRDFEDNKIKNPEVALETITNTTIEPVSGASFDNISQEIQTVSGAAIKLNFDKYFSHRGSLIDAFALGETVTINWTTTENPDQVHSDSAVITNNGTQLVYTPLFDLPDFKFISLEIPTETGSVTASLSENISESLIDDTGMPPPNLDSVTLATGGLSSFALKPDGTWLAWGNNHYGQLSVASENPSSSLAVVVDAIGNPLLNVTKIAAGYVHAVALKDDGSLLAWGDNRSGQLGNGSTIESGVPVEVLDSQNNKIIDIKDIIAIDEVSLAIKENGSLLVWGMDIYGTPGPDTLFSTTPKLVVDGNGQAITGIDKVFPIPSRYGYVIFYVLKAGALFTLDANVVHTETGGYEQRGSRLIPVSIESSYDFDGYPNGAPITGVKSVSSIFRTSYGDELIVLKNDGSLLKREHYQHLFVPVLDGLGLPVVDVQSITSGYAYCIILKKDGVLLALGQNFSGQLGDNTTTDRNVAVNVLDRSGQALNEILDVSTRSFHSIALKSDGSVLAWGDNFINHLNIYPVLDEFVTKATPVTVDFTVYDPNSYEPPIPDFKPLNLGGNVVVDKITVGFVAESPKDYSIQTLPFIKTWIFSQELSGFNVNLITSTYANVGVINQTGNQVSIELTPDTINPVNRIDLQLTDSNGNSVQVDHSDTFWSITKTNHAPQLSNGQVTQMMGGIEDTLALTIETYDIDNDAVTLSVVNADGGTVSFTGNRLYALFGDNQTIHTIQIALNDGKESVIVDIPVLRYDSNTVKTIYSDVAIEHPYAKDIAFATLNGVIWGQDDLANNQQRLFKPDNNASWAEALKMVVKAAKVAKKINLPDSELYLQAFPQWVMPYYTFAREQGAINFKQDDLSITYPTREEIAMLIVRSLGLDNKLEDYPQLTLEFADKAAFTNVNMDRYGQIARIYGLFMTNDFAYPQGRVSRGELAQVISKIFMMPSAEIDVVNSVEFGDGFNINPLINRQAKIINDAYELVDNSANLAVEYAMNFQQLSGLIVDSSSMNVGSNTLIALVDNNGVRDFISKDITVSFTDNDFDGVQNIADVWADDYRYQLDANQNQIPDILDSFYVLSGKTIEDTATMGHLTVPITQLISSGGFVCPQNEVTAFNPLSSEFQTFASLCDVPSAWVIFPGEPIIEPAAGTYHSRVAVSLQSPASTIIYYTLDGSEPDTFSAVYSSPLRLDESATVKMIAVSVGGEISPMMSASYTVLNKHVWKPIPGLSWQWQLQDVFDASVTARVYDVDLFDTPQETITSIKAAGSRVICSFNAGAWENWRSDAADYPEFIKGNVVDGFADEQWLDIRELDTLSPLMQERFDLAVAKGCDAIEPGNVDVYTQSTGFSLTADDQINYNLWLSNQANARGLSIGLKNDLAQIPTLEPFFDWALNEQCLEFNECDALQPFITANKAVFGVEYLTATHTPDITSVCSIADANQYSWIVKRPELDSWVDSCADYRPFIDDDNDGVIDNEDNCLAADNLQQRDTDNDGFGNSCDADLNNDGITNFSDLAKFRQKFNTADPDADLNGDGIVNFADLAVFRSLFNEQPGPSAGH